MREKTDAFWPYSGPQRGWTADTTIYGHSIDLSQKSDELTVKSNLHMAGPILDRTLAPKEAGQWTPPYMAIVRPNL